MISRGDRFFRYVVPISPLGDTARPGKPGMARLDPYIREDAVIRILRVAALTLVLASCTHPSRSGGGRENVITEEEIVGSSATTAYDVILRLRGNFFSDRGKTTILGTSSSKPNVYLDGVQYGELQSLRNIPAGQVATIRLYRAWEAQQKFGTGNSGGVIEVSTRR
jgi:hypothetical protein